jgi:hypothetical protein
MAGPWEKYAVQADQSGPWAKYAAAGGTVDTAPVDPAEADAIRMPQRFQKRAGPPEPWNGPTLPTTDEARAALEPSPNTRYGDILPLARDVDPAGNPVGSPRLAMPNILRSPLLGALDIGQGRVQMDEAGNPLSIRPTPDSQNTLMSVVTPSPAMGTGRAIAETSSYGAPLAELYSRNRLAPSSMPAQSVAAPVASSAAPELPLPAPEPRGAPASADNAPLPTMTIRPDGNTVYLPSGRDVPVRYEVVDAATLKTSHLPDGSPNPAFPPELQPRDRTRAASDIQINRISQGLQPERLGRSSSAMEGAPIIGPDGIVESGNGRTIAILRAYERGDQNAAAYRKYLADQGYDTTGMERPVLVRRRDGDMAMPDRVRLAQEANAEQGLALGAAERAQIDAGRLDDATLNLFRGGDPGSAANADFIRAFVRNVAEPGQEGALATAGGTLSVDGLARMRNALAQKAYGESRLVAAMAEAGDENIKAFGGALMDAAGPMAKLSNEIKAGRVDPGVDLAPAIVKALDIVKGARERRISIADAVGQRDAFGGGADDATEEVLRLAYGPDLKGRINRASLGRALEDYARTAGEQVTGPRLFGENLGRQQLLAEAGGKGRAPMPAAPAGQRNILMPEPQSVGAAATPQAATAMSKAEAQASRTQGETRTLLEAPTPGDTTEYVKGILPTKAELELTPTVSREAKTLRMEKPEPFTELDIARNEIYQDHFDNLAGSATQVLRAREARAAQAETDLKAAWGAKTEANTQPLFEMAAAIKAGPDGRRPLVRSALQSITDELVDAKGNPITDPEILYGVRKHISDMVSKEAQREKPLNQRAEAILLDIRGQLDEVIEAAAPGFRQYLDNYQTASRPIDVMELLQEAKPKITSGADRMIQFSRFDRLMKDLVSDRGASGVNAAKSIDDATWEQLVAMHKSLQRTAYARQLAQAPGSDTTQNMYDLAKKAGTVAAHGVATMVAPVVGNALLPLAAKAMRDRRTTRDVINQLNPNRSKYPDRGP